MKKGKLIVIDGTDGSGKATQLALLKERLRAESFEVESLDFPRYYDNFFGKFIGECLRGDYGDWVNIHPKIASVIYAADRLESKNRIQSWLDAGIHVILDRYVSSNQIHQGGKIANKKDRHEFMTWLDDMEHVVLDIPRPDCIIYLDVPVEISQELLRKKNQTKEKKYLSGLVDLHESDKNHLENAKISAQQSMQELENWKRIDCMRNDELLSIEEVHEKIYSEILVEIKKQD